MHCCPKPVIFPKHVLAPNTSNQSKAMKQSQLLRYTKYIPLPGINATGGTGPVGPPGPVTIGPTGPIGGTGPVGMTGNSVHPVFTSIQPFNPPPIPAGTAYTIPLTMSTFAHGKYIVIFNSQFTFSTESIVDVSYSGFLNGDNYSLTSFSGDTCKVKTEHSMNLCNYTGTPPMIQVLNTMDSALTLSECFVVFVYLNS